jgi:hypothetical protein
MRSIFAVAAVVALAGVLATAGGARADGTFTDPAGDQTKPKAPDITGVEIANTPDGTLTVRVTIANYQSLPPLSGVVIGLDTDRNSATGDGSVDAVLGYLMDPFTNAGVTLLSRWDPNDEELADVDPVPSTVTGNFAAGILTLTAPRSELLYTSAFRFEVVSVALETPFDVDPAADFAPTDTTFWDYELALAPATLSESAPTAAPRTPVAGRALVVSTNVTRSDKSPTATALTASCTARVGATRLRTSSSFVPTTRPLALGEGKARCSLRLPKAAHGKLVRGSISAQVGGATVTRPFAFRVR